MGWNPFKKVVDVVKAVVSPIVDVVDAVIAAVKAPSTISKAAKDISQATEKYAPGYMPQMQSTFLQQYRDFSEASLVVLGNVLVPGSSAITSGFTSQGAQQIQSDPIFAAMNAVAGATGSGLGNKGLTDAISKFGPIQSAGQFTNNAVLNITGSTLIADVATGAVIGGASGALIGGATAAATGQNIGKGMLTGAEYGAASGAIKGWNVGERISGTVGERAAQGIQAGLETFAGEEATGSSLRESLLAGGVSGISTAMFPRDPNASASQRALTDLERTLAQQLLSDYASRYSGDSGAVTSSSGGGGGTPIPPQKPTGATITGSQSGTPGSAALAQALRTGDAGAPIFGSSEDKNKPPTGWNVESLRYMG